MAKYKVTFKKSVTKDLYSIPNTEITRFLKRIDELSDNPRAPGGIKLTGENRYRVRQGLFRIIYQIRDNTLVINVVKIAHRSKARRLSHAVLI